MFDSILINRAIGRTILLLLIMFSCHLSFSSTTISITTASDTNTMSTALDIENGYSFTNHFYKEPIVDQLYNGLLEISLSKIVEQDGKLYLFVVSQNSTLIQFDLNTLAIVKTYKPDVCSKLKSCKKKMIINYISNIEILGVKMMYFCFIIHYGNDLESMTSCYIPKNNYLSVEDEIKWRKKGFTSSDVKHETFSVNTRQYVVAATYVDSSLTIMRSKLPDISGSIDSSGDLITPVAPFYFEENSNFVGGFKTDFESYFLVTEYVNSQLGSFSSCLETSNKKENLNRIFVSRLIRICTDDPGGVVEGGINNFGTFAKADIICPIIENGNEYHFTRAVASSWVGDTLYVLFRNQPSAPIGAVICAYKKTAFDNAFNGPTKHQTFGLKCDGIRDIIKSNNLPDICQRLSTETLSEQEKEKASTIATDGLYRDRKIYPMYGRLFLNLHTMIYDKIYAFKLLDETEIIIVTYGYNIRLYNYRKSDTTQSDNLCYQSTHRTQYYITGIDNTFQNPKLNQLLLLVSTTNSVEKLNLNVCSRFSTRTACLTHAPQYCGWWTFNKPTASTDNRNGKCGVWEEEYKKERSGTIPKEPMTWIRSKGCDGERVSGFSVSSTPEVVYSDPEDCYLQENNVHLRCLCRYCIWPRNCNQNRKAIDVFNCAGNITVESWREWSSWSTCKLANVRKRKGSCIKFDKATQSCKDQIAMTDIDECKGSVKENEVSPWTPWSYNHVDNVIERYRAECFLKNASMMSNIMYEQKPCEKNCINEINQLSEWSNWYPCTKAKYQYRLRNCSDIHNCDPRNMEVKFCAVHKKVSSELGGFSFIHLTLAVLIVSIFWMVVVIIFVTCLVKRRQIRTIRHLPQPHFFTTSSQPKTLLTNPRFHQQNKRKNGDFTVYQDGYNDHSYQYSGHHHSYPFQNSRIKNNCYYEQLAHLNKTFPLSFQSIKSESSNDYMISDLNLNNSISDGSLSTLPSSRST